ncbi:hypothetical protein PBI_INDLOVU_95 [Mycobacterium phage Indlovu]|nr:hypothetical protein PBI_INDLOVU_95 [Mycobacterium phage Indlovu]
MAAKIEFTATAPSGETFTRTSGTMPYTHVLLVAGKGESDFGPWSWHKSAAAAFKASQESYHQDNHRTKVVPAVPTAVKGKAEVGDFPAEKGWQEEAINALIEAKGAKSKKADAMTELPELGYEVVQPEDVVVDETPVDEPVVEQPEAEVQAEAIENGEATPIAPAKPKGGKVAQRQALGALVHQAVQSILDGELPEGMTAEDAALQLDTWLRYIPNGARAAGSAAYQARQAQA